MDFTKVDSTGEIKKRPWAWENNYNVCLKTVFGIYDNGAAIFAFLPRFYTDDELDVLETEEVEPLFETTNSVHEFAFMDNTLIAMQALDNGEFRILFSGNRMVEMYYGETIPARPSKELTVYSLEENARIRYARQLFQKQNPDVLVVYETGMDGRRRPPAVESDNRILSDCK